MGKRSNFDRIERDFYATPMSAVLPLAEFLVNDKPTSIIFQGYSEPCAGDGRLVSHIHAKTGIECGRMSDIHPMAEGIDQADFFQDNIKPKSIITNPPWDRKFLHPMMDKIIHEYKVPALLLFDADWMHTKQASPYMKYCLRIISVGRVKWIEDSKMTGKDNCAWYFFGPFESGCTIFQGR